MTYVDENGIEWTEIGAYRLAVVDGQVVVAPIPEMIGGAVLPEYAAAGAHAAFMRDMAALEEAGMISLSKPEEGQ